MLMVVALVRILTAVLFLPFFLTKVKFLYKFNLVFSFKGFGFRQ